MIRPRYSYMGKVRPLHGPWRRFLDSINCQDTLDFCIKLAIGAAVGFAFWLLLSGMIIVFSWKQQ